MVRAGKVAKGFTPRDIEEQEEKEIQDEQASAVLLKLKEWWSACLIQRTWRRKREQHPTSLQWGGSGALECGTFSLSCCHAF